MKEPSSSIMNKTEQTGDRSLSHADYLATLHRPSTSEWRRISEIQARKEGEIDGKYHSTEEHEAATKIQKAYRGHRVRRQLEGLTLDPSSRWVEVIKEWKYRSATVPDTGRERTLSSKAMRNPTTLLT